MNTEKMPNYQARWIEGLNRGDISVADEAFAPNCTIHVTGFPEPIKGVAAWKEAIAGFLAAFPDMHFTIDDHITSGDTVAFRWHAEGTHRGPFGPLPPTGRRVSFNGLLYDRVAYGRVVERWEQFDQPAILRDLDVG